MPASYFQASRPMTVTTPLGPDVMLLVGFSGHEGISQLFRFELDLAAEDQSQVVFDKLLGHKVTINLTVPGGQERHFSGICTSLSQGLRGTGDTMFRMEIAPHLWLLTRRSRSRIFQNVSVPEIVKKVLDIPDVVYDLEGTFHPRTFCVQYRETDFNFVSRLMEEEGIYYYFKHKADSHQMVVSNKAAFPELQPGELIVQQAEGTHVEEERISHWQKRQQLRSAKVTLRDYHFQLPRRSLQAEQEIQDDVKVGKITHKLRTGDSDHLEVYDWPGAYSHRFDGIDRGGADRPDDLQKLLGDNKRTAKIRMEQEASEAVVTQGASKYRHLASGHTFALKEQVMVPYTGSSSHDGKYVVTSIRHNGRLSGSYRSGEVQELHYDNTFTCIPAALHYRPPRTTQKPVISGPQTAVVVGKKGEQIHLDKYGRVKVQFHWDREGKNDADSSCWIRVSQIWAGKGWGTFFWPRVGHEVVVAFEEGDPDRPLITGSVYNADNTPPFELPLDGLVNGFKSCTELGDSHDKFNGLIFYDKPGKEHVHIHSQNHQVLTNESSSRVHVGRNYAQVVGGIPGLSSGSGGGGATGPTAEGDQVKDGLITDIGPLPTSDRKTSYGDQAPAEWGLPGDLARQVNLAFGEVFESTVGLKYEQRVGGKTEFYFNPLAWIAGSTNPVLMGLFASLLTKTEVKLCAETSLLYGTKIDIHRGGKVEYEADKVMSSDASFALANATMGLQMLGTLVAGATASNSDFWSDFRWFLFNLPWQVLLCLLVEMETSEAILKHAQFKVDDAKETLEAIMNLLDPQYKAGVEQTKEMKEHAEEKTDRAVRLLAEILQLTTEGDTKESFSKGDRSHLVNGTYEIDAQNFTVYAKPSADGGSGSSIRLNAVGSSGKNDAAVALSADGQVYMTTGRNYLGHFDTNGPQLPFNEAHVTLIECGDDTGGGSAVYIRQLADPPAKETEIRLRKPGEIRLRVGNEFQDEKLGYTEIELTQGAFAGISLKCSAMGNTSGIDITPVSVELYNAFGCKLSLGDPGNPANASKITIEGLDLELSGDLKGKISALIREEVGGATHKHTAPITTKGAG
jgi:type VI secretion system secreted protein VgrG